MNTRANAELEARTKPFTHPTATGIEGILSKPKGGQRGGERIEVGRLGLKGPELHACGTVPPDIQLARLDLQAAIKPHVTTARPESC